MGINYVVKVTPKYFVLVATKILYNLEVISSWTLEFSNTSLTDSHSSLSPFSNVNSLVLYFSLNTMESPLMLVTVIGFAMIDLTLSQSVCGRSVINLPSLND